MAYEKRYVQGQITAVFPIKSLNTKKGIRNLADIKVSTIGNESLTVGVWLEGNDVPLYVGQEIIAPVSIIQKTSGGKQYTNYSCGIKDVETTTQAVTPNTPHTAPPTVKYPKEYPQAGTPVPRVDPPKPTEKPTQEYWDKRNDSIVKQHSQEMGLRMVEILAKVKNEELAVLSQDQIKMLVDKYTEWFMEDVVGHKEITLEKPVEEGEFLDEIPF